MASRDVEGWKGAWAKEIPLCVEEVDRELRLKTCPPVASMRMGCREGLGDDMSSLPGWCSVSVTADRAVCKALERAHREVAGQVVCRSSLAQSLP